MADALVRREQTVVAVCLAALVGLSWAWLIGMNGGMSMADMPMAGMTSDAGMGDMVMPMTGAWTTPDVTVLFVMWAVMMVGMMLPSAAPMILTFVGVNRRRQERGGRAVGTAVFVAGYLVAWTTFSAAAAGAQWGLHDAALLSPAMRASSGALGGGLLIVAGLFQWTRLKGVCLSRCRSPLSFLMTEWREGRAGAFVMGLRHGVFCVGCCWALMALLFAAGVMNLFWVAALAALVLVEKIVPRGAAVARGVGILLVAAGVWMAIATT